MDGSSTTRTSLPRLDCGGTATGRPARVAVTRIGTQVVVRLSGVVDERASDRLHAAVGEVEELALHRVAVDLDEVDHLDAAGLEFIARLADRWTLRVLNSPPALRR